MTLVEMLVVLAIIGVAAGAVALGMGSATRGNRVESEARQLGARLRLAADDAMVQDRGLAFIHDGRGYAFVVLDEDGKSRPASDTALSRHDLPSGITLDAGHDLAPMPIGVDGAGLPITARVEGSGKAWSVAWDGLNVVVTSVSAS